jgi:hypothetical protein
MTDAEQPCKCLEGAGHRCRPPFYDGDDWPVTQPVPGTSIGRVEDWLWDEEGK